MRFAGRLIVRALSLQRDTPHGISYQNSGAVELTRRPIHPYLWMISARSVSVFSAGGGEEGAAGCCGGAGRCWTMGTAAAVVDSGAPPMAARLAAESPMASRLSSGESSKSSTSGAAITATAAAAVHAAGVRRWVAGVWKDRMAAAALCGVVLARAGYGAEAVAVAELCVSAPPGVK
jgi:hypothetical protein